MQVNIERRTLAIKLKLCYQAQFLLSSLIFASKLNFCYQADFFVVDVNCYFLLSGTIFWGQKVQVSIESFDGQRRRMGSYKVKGAQALALTRTIDIVLILFQHQRHVRSDSMRCSKISCHSFFLPMLHACKLVLISFSSNSSQQFRRK